MAVITFKDPGTFRQWLEKNHSHEKELWVSYYKKTSGIRSITYPESLEEALCYGWIDGVRRSLDEKQYMIRFTPRKPGSAWSKVNIGKAEKLIQEGRMKPAGLEAYRFKNSKRTGSSRADWDKILLPASYEKIFRRNKKAWDFFLKQVPSYRIPCLGWLMSAKKEETRLERLNTLIRDSEEGRFIAPMRWNKNSKPKT